MIEKQLEGQMSIFDLDSQFGKMLPEPSPVTAAKTSKGSSRSSSASPSRTLPMFLYLTADDGQSQGASWGTVKTDALFPSVGEYTMHSFGECPKEENASHLSQILEESAPAKYCLSERAAAGIIRRADKRGKELPEILRKALEQVCEKS